MKKIIFILFIYFGINAHLNAQIQVGASQINENLWLFKGKRIGLIVNQSSEVNKKHVVDIFLENKQNIVTIFAPEHGFRGNVDAGEKVENELDKKTGIPVVSLYGKHKKPTPEDLKDIDLLVFDIQDVGVRFFTYISTLYLCMEAAAENGKPFVVLDRPNPLGDYIDGPVLDKKFSSFVGMVQVPIVHGLTIAELAQMIKGESWINKAADLQLKVLPCKGYTHRSRYELPVKPSPNLPTTLAVRLYPSLCFFEATNVSIGRGTYAPFMQIGYPDTRLGSHSFVPQDIAGMQNNPLHEGKVCWGDNLTKLKPWEQKFTLKYILNWQKKWKDTTALISNERWFNLLAGTDKLLAQIKRGETEKQIRKSWEKELSDYRKMRSNYLLYP